MVTAMDFRNAGAMVAAEGWGDIEADVVMRDTGYALLVTIGGFEVEVDLPCMERKAFATGAVRLANSTGVLHGVPFRSLVARMLRFLTSRDMRGELLASFRCVEAGEGGGG
jgi:hypothetical protein